MTFIVLSSDLRPMAKALQENVRKFYNAKEEKAQLDKLRSNPWNDLSGTANKTVQGWTTAATNAFNNMLGRDVSPPSKIDEKSNDESELKPQAPTWQPDKEEIAETTAKLNTSTVTLVGHTDETRETLGGKNAKEIAQILSKQYGNDKKNLKEVFLFACEAGAKKQKKGVISEAFAQELAEAMAKESFDPELQIWSIEPSPNTFSMRVAATTQSLFGAHTGTVYAYSFTDENAENEFFALPKNQQGLEQVKNFEKQGKMKLIVESETNEHYQATFRRATCFQCRNIKQDLANDNQNNTTPNDYLQKIINNRGTFINWLRKIFSKPLFTKMLDQQFNVLENTQNEALTQAKDLKRELLGALVTRKKESWKSVNSERWEDLAYYVRNADAMDAKERELYWQKVEKHSTHYLEDKPLKKLTPHCSYQEAYQKIKTTHLQFKKVEKQQESLRTIIGNVVNNYIEDNKDPEDDIHQAKVRVMTAIQNYLKEPIESNWNKVTIATNDKKNKGWDSGVFSKVSKIHEKITTLKMENKM